MLSLDTGSGVQYYHHDALGSTVNLTTDSGSVKVSYWLDPYGQIRKQEGTSVNRQIFTGQEHDEKTGLVYFGARYYDPDTARFITQDSYLGESGTPPSLHRYLYAYLNPTVYVDLYGYEAWSLVQPSVNSETDIFGPTPVRDTGNQYLDEAWAGLDIVLAAPKYVVNAASAVASTPTIGYAKAKGISVQEADEEIAGYMASSGPLAPYLLTGTAPFRVGSTVGYSARVLRAEAKAARKTAANITKELRSGAVDIAYEAVETVAQKTGAKQYVVSPNEPGLRKTVIRRRPGQPDARIEPAPPETTYNLYQKVDAEGKHLKYGMTKDLDSRYTPEELAGGQLRKIAESHDKKEILKLERNLHKTLPIGLEEGQDVYVEMQKRKGLKPPPYE